MVNRIVNEVTISLENECYIAALALALTLPDVCGKAEYPREYSGPRYKKWFETYLQGYNCLSYPYGKDMPYSSAEVIYQLRNNLLHQVTPNIDGEEISEERCKVDHFILTVSDKYDMGTSIVFYDNPATPVERCLKVNVVYLCNKLCSAAKTYYNNNPDKYGFIRYELQDNREQIDKA